MRSFLLSLTLIGLIALIPACDDSGGSSTTDVCEGVDCGSHGQCLPVADAPSCTCDDGYHDEDLTCTADNTSPAITDLPATESGPAGATDSYQITTVDTNEGDSLDYSLQADGCSFTPSVDGSGLVSWTCGATEVCEVTVTVTDDGSPQLSASGSLIIECVNSLPAFTTAPESSATEAVEYLYHITCTDPEGDTLTLGVGEYDTCSGTLTDNGDGTGSYAFTPSEAMGGATCHLSLTCADTEGTEHQDALIAINEVNAAPAIINLPASASTLWGTAGSFTVTAQDLDFPTNTLTFAITSHTCTDASPLIDATTGEIDWTCGAPEECDIEVSVADDGDPVLEATGTLHLSCTNSAPTFLTTPPANAAEETLYEYAVVCIDADGNPLTLTLGSGDSCGGTLMDNGNGTGTYSFTPDETMGGTTCFVQVECSDTMGTLSQGATVTIAEVNTAPVLETLDASLISFITDPGSFTVMVSDSDLPANTLTTVISGNTCSFTPTIDSSRTINFTCVTVEECDIEVLATDSGTPVLTDSGTLHISCLNNAPTLDATAPAEVRERFTSSFPVVCADVDGQPLALTLGITDTCDGTLIDLGDGTGLYSLSPAFGTADSTCLAAVQCADPYDTASREWTIAIDPIRQPLAAGYFHTCRLEQGRTYCTGNNSYGQLGTGTTTNSLTFLAETNAWDNWTTLDDDGYNSFGLAGGFAFGWGRNSYGQLGDGTTTTRSSPTQVLNLTNVVHISSGYMTANAILEDGTLWGWGDAADNGTGTTSYTPVQVALTDVTTSDSGQIHSCAIAAGAMWCWGNNIYGSLGTGNTVSSPTPVQEINGWTDWWTVTTGYYATCALRGTGALYCLGRNTYGQLGLGNTTHYTAPQQVGTFTDWMMVSIEEAHACGIRQNGTLYCWGYNSNGQLGLGDTTQHTTPQQVGTLTDWVFVDTGLFHTCAYRANGDLYCWGYNNYGQLGLGNTTQYTTPQLVPAP